ncbi:hypothetical protein GTW51_10530 [Aurantimonas aggregata]|uniref:Uncharacterized protein n=1 Tax=Aurantimonas aggregata TaxID=2047720 RepID=A0A6L9MHJ3_9HYPH|nr:hypothetical protein [Aurantimonas aggregata]NDV87136.1 hypothetical protein [Aurantimonas aggregata]
MIITRRQEFTEPIISTLTYAVTIQFLQAKFSARGSATIPIFSGRIDFASELQAYRIRTFCSRRNTYFGTTDDSGDSGAAYSSAVF